MARAATSPVVLELCLNAAELVIRNAIKSTPIHGVIPRWHHQQRCSSTRKLFPPLVILDDEAPPPAHTAKQQVLVERLKLLENVGEEVSRKGCPVS